MLQLTEQGLLTISKHHHYSHIVNRHTKMYTLLQTVTGLENQHSYTIKFASYNGASSISDLSSTILTLPSQKRKQWLEITHISRCHFDAVKPVNSIQLS